MQFTGLTDEERVALKSARQGLQAAGELLRTARQEFDAYVQYLRSKYGLSPADQIMDQTEQELQNAGQAQLDAAQLALETAMMNTTPAERAKYDAWVAAGRPVPEKRGVFSGR